MQKIWIIAKMSLLENSRKQVFHVLCLLMIMVIAGSTLLSIFTEGVKLKILKDLCTTCILFGGAVLAIALGATGIPNDVESRTIFPIIARPVTRMQYIIGKFLGTILTVAMGVAAMSVVFGALIYTYQRSFDTFLPIVTLFTMLEVAVIAAVATAISTLATPAMSAILTFIIYVCGTIKIGYFGGMINQSGGVAKAVSCLIYHFLPNLECFNLKTALVHSDTIPTAYLVQVAVYGLCYVAFMLALASIRFAKREV